MIEQYSYGLNQRASENNNVVDIYKQWQAAEIRADLETKRSPMVNICMNLTHDFNKASIIRAANAFLAKETYIVGRRRFDRRGGVGTHHYEHVFHADAFQEVFDILKKKGYNIYAIDNIEDISIPKYNLENISLPALSAFVYGEECLGLDKDIIKLCDGMIYIPQLGSVRSLNVSQAAACIMYEYNKQYQGGLPEW